LKIRKIEMKRRMYNRDKARRLKRKGEGTVATIVKREIRKQSESHFYAPALSATFGSVSTAWVETDMLGVIAGGAQAYERVGRKVMLESVRLHGVLLGGAVSGIADDAFNVFRLVCYVSKTAGTGAARTPLQTLGYNASFPINKDQLPGFHTMVWDQMFGLTNQPYGAGSAAPANKEVDLFHRFNPPLEIDYYSAAQHTNSTQLYLAMISDSVGIPNPGFAMGFWQIRFRDM